MLDKFVVTVSEVGAGGGGAGIEAGPSAGGAGGPEVTVVGRVVSTTVVFVVVPV